MMHKTLPSHIKTILFLFLITYSSVLVAQSPVHQWSNQAGQAGGINTLLHSVGSDSNNNAIVVGTFSGTTDADQGAGYYPLYGIGDEIYIASYSQSGNLQWAKTVGGPGADDVYGVTILNQDKIVIYGTISAGAVLDLDNQTVIPPVNGITDAFFAIYDSSGNYLNHVVIGGSDYDNVKNLTTDAAGNFYATGIFKGDIDLDPGPGTYILTGISGFNNQYYAKYSASGALIWGYVIDCSFSYPGEIKLTTDGALYLTGEINGVADMDPGTSTILDSAIQNSNYLLKLDTNGTYLWHRMIADGTSLLDGMAIDQLNYCYIAGNFSQTTDFDPGPGYDTLNPMGTPDAYIVKYDPSGQRVWKQIFQTPANTVFSIRKIAQNGSGRIFITGYSQGNLDYDPGPGTANVNTLTNSGFCIRMDTSGNYLSNVNTSGGNVVPYCIKTCNNGDVCISGMYAGTPDFDPGTATVTLPQSQGNTMFCWRLDSTMTFKSVSGNVNLPGGSIFSITQAIDNANNTIVAANFNGTIDSNSSDSVFTALTATGTDFMLSKYNASGQYVWGFNLGGTTTENVNAVTTDNAGNIYITGHFGTTVDFDPGPGNFSVTATGAADLFIAKYDSNGNFIWANNCNGSGFETGTGIQIGSTGDVYVTARFDQAAIFGYFTGAFSLQSNGMNDGFIAKYNAQGNFLWAKQIGGSGYDVPAALELGQDDAIYITGHFENTVDFDPDSGTTNLVSNGLSDQFMLALDSAGALRWAKQVGGIGADEGSKLLVDQNSSIYATGYFENAVATDNNLSSPVLTSAGMKDILFIRYDTAGNYTWIKGIGGAQNDQGSSLGIDSLNRIYLNGVFSDSCDMNPGSGTNNLYAEGSLDLFIALYDTTGSYIHAVSIGTTQMELAGNLTVKPSADLWLSARYGGHIDLQPGYGTAYQPASSLSSAFWARYRICDLPTQPVFASGGTLQICAGATISDSITGGSPGTDGTWTWYSGSCGGTVISTGSTLNTTALPGINIFVQSTGGCMSGVCNTYNFTLNQLPVVTISTNPDTICYDDAPINLSAFPQGGVFSGNGVTAMQFDPFTAGPGNQLLTYSYTDNNGCTGISTDTILVEQCFGLPDFNTNFGVFLAPQPANEFLKIKLNSSSNRALLKLYNAFGQVVADVTTTEKTISITTLEFPAGIYLLTVESGNRKMVKPLVISH